MDSSATATSSPSSPNSAVISPLACVLFGFASMLLFGLSLAWPDEPGWWGPGVSTLLAYLFVGIHLAISGRRLSAFDPGLWIPVTMLTFYFSIPIAVNFGVGFVDYDAWLIGHPPQLTHAFVVALLAVVAFLFGFQIAGVRDYGKPVEPQRTDPALMLAGGSLAFGGMAMIAIGIALVGPGVIFGTYGDMKYSRVVGGLDTRLLIGSLFAAGGLYALVGVYDGTRRQILYVVAAAAAFITGFEILTGNRGGVFGIVFSLGWAFTVKVRRLPKWWSIGIFLMALVAMPVVAEYRAFKSAEESLQLGVAELLTLALRETGSTLLTIAYSIEHIPKDKPYDWGMSVVGTLISTIPNLGLSAGKSFELDALKHIPSTWLVWQINPLKFELGGGYGSSIVAEWFFNFGMPGVFLGMVATGFVTARIRNAAYRSGMMLAWSSLYTYMLLLLVRNCTISLFRAALWPLIGLIVLRFIYSKLGVGTSRTAALPMRPGTTGLSQLDSPRAVSDDR